MKTFVAAFLIITLALAGCESKKETLSETELEKEREAVALVLEKYVIANERQEIDLVKDIWAPDEDIVVFGTDSDEKIVGWESIRNTLEEQFRSFNQTYISVRDQNIRINEYGCTAWFSEIVNYNYIHNGEAMSYEGLRFTGVLEKRNGDWYIVQSHMSIPGNSR